MRAWVFDPHSGGVKIPPRLQSEVTARLEQHAAKRYAGLYARLDIRFRGPLCYMDAYIEPKAPSPEMLKAIGETREHCMERMRSFPTRLGRLRYFGDNRWSYAFFTYSHEKYEPSLFPDGEWFGSPEDAFDIGAMYLTEN